MKYECSFCGSDEDLSIIDDIPPTAFCLNCGRRQAIGYTAAIVLLEKKLKKEQDEGQKEYFRALIRRYRPKKRKEDKEFEEANARIKEIQEEDEGLWREWRPRL